MDKPTILVIDDTPENLSLISGLLKDLYHVKVAPSAFQHSGIRSLEFT